MSVKLSQYGFIHTGLLTLLLGVTLTIGCCAAAYAAEPATASDQVVTLDVRNMTCAMCPITVRKSLTRLEGVSSAEVSYQDKTAVVTYDPQKISTDRLTQATTDAGYPSTVKD